jgi:hypothetical protein
MHTLQRSKTKENQSHACTMRGNVFLPVWLLLAAGILHLTTCEATRYPGENQVQVMALYTPSSASFEPPSGTALSKMPLPFLFHPNLDRVSDTSHLTKQRD